MRHYYKLIRTDPVWSKVVSFSIVVFLIKLADALVSFWAPELIQSSFNSSFMTGLVISFQSIVGFSADLIFPKLLKKAKVKRLIILAIFMSGLTSICLYISSLRPWTIFFLIAMAIWGIYYELSSFGSYQFIDNTVPRDTRSAAWGILGVFMNLAYLLGPLIAVWLLLSGSLPILVFILVLLFSAFTLFSFRNRMQDTPLEPDINDIKPGEEIGYWQTLFKSTWPIILITLLTGFIDSTFWTTGVVWTTKLIQENPLGSLFIPFYQLPPLFMGLLVAKWGIYKGKKRLALKFLIIAGFFLASLYISNSVFWFLAAVLASSIALSITYPLLEGVYSDIIQRLGKEKKHMIGLTSSTVNISYIVWPPIAGLIAANAGEKMTFVYIGVLTVVVSLVLLFIIPKKLKVHQEEVAKWKD